MSHATAFFLVFGLALSVTLILVPLGIYLGRRFGVTVKAGGRRQSDADRRRLSRLGGIAIFGGFVTAVLAAQILPVPRMDPYEIIRLTGLLLGAACIFIVGLLDDIFEFSSLPQFLGQYLAAAIAISFQIFIEFFNNPLTGQQTDPWPFIVTVTISFFWLVGMMNTMNWLDGLDGLAGGVALIAAVLLFVNSAFRVEEPQISVSLLHLALMGATLGFLLFNFNPARIVLGSGAVLLGYILGSLSIIGGAKMATILLVMGLPLLDAVWQIVNRVRSGRSPFEGDRGHLHFRLVDMGLSQRQIVLGYYGFCALFGGIALITSSQLFKFIALGVLLLIATVGFIGLSRLSHGRSSSAAGAAGVAGAAGLASGADDSLEDSLASSAPSSD
ncbi:MAG: undecaprenyl/decaprenyl-phosphate alpha-N-acetylglucosaminyl 1-phosphate transferase [Chloroflexi bacterium]|nr:undecaprenyl/decaprenyl-phosphate alpha-N-acetylglucosaminyl 1-phosphate transferase [Chloroflexota bacterium]